MGIIEKMMNQLLYFACLLTRADYDLARDSNRMDQLTIIFQAMTLMVLTSAATLSWSAFWSSFLSPWIAVFLGLLVASHIFLLDQAMGCSDWELAGVLVQPSAAGNDGGFNRHWWGKFALRVAISLILAQATAVGVTLWMFADAIDSHLQKKRASINSPIEKEYNERKAEAKVRLVEPIEHEMSLLSDENNALLQAIRESRQESSKALNRAANARIEAEREHDGGLKNYYRGEGPLFREARRQELEANRLREALNTAIVSAEERLNQNNIQLEAKRRDLAAMNDKLNLVSKQLDIQKISDDRWEKENTDPLTRYIGLHELKSSIKYGDATMEISHLMNMLLVTLELIFLAIKMIFAPASVYQVRLISRTKLEAARESARFAHELEKNYQNHPKGKWRVLSDIDVEANRHRQNMDEVNHPLNA